MLKLIDRPVGTPQGYRLASGIALVVILVALISCVAVGLLSYYVRSESLRAERFNELELLRDEKIARIDDWVGDRVTDVRDLANGSKVRLMAESLASGKSIDHSAIATTMASLALSSSFYGFGLVDPNSGRFVASTIVNVADLPPLSEGDRQAASLGTGKVLGSVFLAPPSSIPTVYIGFPIQAANTGHVVAIAIGLVDLSKTFYPGIVDSGKRFGRTGEVVLVNPQGVVQNPLRNAEHSTAQLVSSAEPARRGGSGGTGIIASLDYRSHPVQAAYGFIPSLGWGIVVKKDLAEINEELDALAGHILLLTCIVLVLAASIGVFLSRRISIPASRIARVAELIRRGDQSHRAVDEGPRELRAIAQGLNHLVDELSTQIRCHKTMTELVMAASGVSRVQDLHEKTLPLLINAMGAQLGVVYTNQGDDRRFTLTTGQGVDHELTPREFHVAPADNWLSEPAKSGVVRLLDEIPKDIGLGLMTPAGRAEPRALLAIPLTYSGRTEAIIAIGKLNQFGSGDLSLAHLVAQLFGQAVVACREMERSEILSAEVQEANSHLEARNDELITQADELKVQSEQLRETAVELEIRGTQLAESDRVKSEFLSTMSHELRTPLNSILALTQLMGRKTVNEWPEKYAEYIQVIERNGRGLLVLINDVLDLTKIEAGRAEVVVTTFDIMETIQQVSETIRPLAAEKSIDLRLIAPQRLEVHSDGSKIHQVLMNLLSNAVKFTEQGHVEVDVRSENNQLRIVVSDTGIGIAPEHLDLVFAEFRQIDGSTTRKYGGTGLGLSIARKLARILGGDIVVVSRMGHGSQFELTLPLKYSQLIELPTSTGFADNVPDPLIFEVAGIKVSPAILVVDDNDTSRCHLQTVLEDAGYQVHHAEDGSKAVVWTATNVPRAILLDLMMPELDGFQVLETIRSRSWTKHLPVIVITAKEITASDRRILARHRVEHVIQKGSISREQLLSRIASLIGQPSGTAQQTPKS